MKKQFVIVLLLFAGGQLLAQSDFATLMHKNLEYFQNSNKLTYSLSIDLFRDSLSTDVLSHEQMHVYKSGKEQCVMTDGMLMIEDGETHLSILSEEEVVILQGTSDSFQLKYMEQMSTLLGNWETLKPSLRKGTSKAEATYRIEMPGGSEYSVIDMTFNLKTGRLTATTMWLEGAYYFGNETYNAPRIELTFGSLEKPEIARIRTRDILTGDHKLKGAYASFTLHNTIQKLEQ